MEWPSWTKKAACGFRVGRQDAAASRDDFPSIFRFFRMSKEGEESVAHESYDTLLPQEHQNVVADIAARDIVGNKIITGNFRHLTALETNH